MATALHAIEGEDTLAALLEFRCGALGVFIAATSIYPGYPRRLEVSGSQGTIILEHDRLAAIDLRDSPGERVAPAPAATAQNASSAAVADTAAHQAVLEDFLRAIATNTQPACSGSEARKSLVLAEAIYESSRTGKRVALA